MAYAAIRFWGAAVLGVLTLVAGVVRIAARSLGPNPARYRVDAFGGLLVIVGIVIITSNDVVAARLYPVIVNLAVLGYFAWSLIHPPSAVERIARLADRALPDYAVAYTRRVTAVWCMFFVVNGAIALYTALWTSIEVWTLYNGCIAYLLMGSLFTGEYLVRRRTRAAHEAASD
jgi:uncharacterized membrane protein